jgi:membrane protease YdiL (CAAX protease family)
MQTAAHVSKRRSTRIRGLEHLALSALVLIGMAAIFVLGSPYFSLFPTNRSSTYDAVLTVSLLTVTSLVYLNHHTRKYWRACFACFAAAVANWTLGLDLVVFPGDSANTVAGITWNKLAQFLEVVPPILLLIFAVRDDLGSLYLRRGKTGAWMVAGLGSLFAFGVLGVVVGSARGKELDVLLSTLPLWLVFSLLNAFMEELWYRGLFLPRLSPVVGEGLSILLIAIAFAAAHVGVVYVTPGEILQFVAPVFFLGLGTGYLVVKTGSLWGAVLLHAGANLFYALAFSFF